VAVQRVAGRAGQTGPRDPHREAGQGVPGDGDGQVAGAGDPGGRDPGLAGQALGQGRGCLLRIAPGQAEREAGGTAARLRARAEPRLSAGLAGHGEDGPSQLGGEHLPHAGQLADDADHLVRVEGLGQVGVGADLGASGLVVFLGAGADQQHLDVGSVR
jgi:hypothetical protein